MTGKAPVSRFSLTQTAIRTKLPSAYTEVAHTNGVAAVAGNVNFQLATYNDYSGYEALFDQFRIRRITFYVMPANNVNQIGTTAITASVGVFVPDFDAATVPSTTATGFVDLVMKPAHKVWNMVSRPIYSISFVPRPYLDAEGGTARWMMPDVWVDTANASDLSFSSIKYWVRNPYPAGSNVQAFTYWSVAEVEFRGQHSASNLMHPRPSPLVQRLPEKTEQQSVGLTEDEWQIVKTLRSRTTQ